MSELSIIEEVLAFERGGNWMIFFFFFHMPESFAILVSC